jgi:hypothetical protein
LIAQHGQVETIVRPNVKPTIKPIIETTFDAHQYTIQADRNEFNDIPIGIQSKLIAINLTIYSSIYDPS